MDENTSQTTQEMPKGRRERIAMFTSTFVLHYFSFPFNRKKIQIPYWNGHVTYGKEYLIYFRCKSSINPRKHKLKTLHAPYLPNEIWSGNSASGLWKGPWAWTQVTDRKVHTFLVILLMLWGRLWAGREGGQEVIPWQCKQRLIISYYKGMMFPCCRCSSLRPTKEIFNTPTKSVL